MSKKALLEVLRSTEEEIPSELVRGLCGKPANNTWTDWRRRLETGLKIQPLRKGQRKLTRLQAYLLIAFAHWKEIQEFNGKSIKEIERQFPKDLTKLAEEASGWFAAFVQAHPSARCALGITGNSAEITGRDLPELITDWLQLTKDSIDAPKGAKFPKSRINEATVALRCKALFRKWSVNMRITPDMVRTLQEHWFDYATVTEKGRSLR